MLWPGLNSPIIQGKELIQQQKLPDDPEREAKLLKLRDEMGAFRLLRLSPLDRGWSGPKLPGRSVGRPDPVGEGNPFLYILCPEVLSNNTNFSF
jgi:small subunit ribosomal protein S5